MKKTIMIVLLVLTVLFSGCIEQKYDKISMPASCVWEFLNRTGESIDSEEIAKENIADYGRNKHFSDDAINGILEYEIIKLTAKELEEKIDKSFEGTIFMDGSTHLNKTEFLSKIEEPVYYMRSIYIDSNGIIFEYFCGE